MSGRRYLTTPLVSTATSIAEYSRPIASDLTPGAADSVLVSKSGNAAPSWEVSVNVPLLSIGGEAMYNQRYASGSAVNIGGSSSGVQTYERIYRAGKCINFTCEGVTIPASNALNGELRFFIPSNYRPESGYIFTVIVRISGVPTLCRATVTKSTVDYIAVNTSLASTDNVVAGTEYVVQPFTVSWGNNILA